MNETEQKALDRATAFLSENTLETKASEMPPPEPKVVTPNDLGSAPVAKVEEPAKVEQKPSLADAIKADREARQRAQTAQVEATKYKDEVTSLKAEVERYRKLADINDPLEFVRAKKLTPEEQALWGQAFLYELKPEVAPPEFRLELYKAQRAKEEADARAAAEKAQAEEAANQQREGLQRYYTHLRSETETFTAGSHPESEAWFTTDDGVDHDAYTQSLFATANNLAESAQRAGRQADLSPANVARVLEDHLSTRQKRRDARRSTGKPNEATKVESGTATADTALSTKTLAGGASPRQPAKDDHERAQRAAAVLFGTK